MSQLEVFPRRTMRHNSQHDNSGSHGIPAGADCWYTAAAMLTGFLGVSSGEDDAVDAIKEAMEGDGRTSPFREFLRGARHGHLLRRRDRLAVAGEFGALFLAWYLKPHGMRVIWSPGYRDLAAVGAIARANDLPLLVAQDWSGTELQARAREGSPAILSTMATSSGHYVAVSGVWERDGEPAGLRIEDSHGRYPYMSRSASGAANLHSWEALAAMRKNLGWRYVQVCPS